MTPSIEQVAKGLKSNSASKTDAAAMGVVIVLTRVLAHRRRVRRLVDIAAIAVVLLVGADRVFLGLHYLSDVVAGYLLGVGVLLFWLAVYDPNPRPIAPVK